MVIASCVAAPGMRVIVLEVTPMSEVALKFNSRSPVTPVIDRSVKVATPAALVSTVVVPPSVPPPVAMETVTPTPAWLTALPAASRSWSAGCWAKTTLLAAAADGWLVSERRAAAPTLMAIGFEVAPASVGTRKFSVRSPAVPVMDRSRKVAAPLTLVIAVSVPPSVPPPVAIAAVPSTPTSLTGLPAASRSWMTGCWANATPLVAAAEGWVVIASFAAGPVGSGPVRSFCVQLPRKLTRTIVNVRVAARKRTGMGRVRKNRAVLSSTISHTS